MDRIGIERHVGVIDGQLIADIQRAARAVYGPRVLHINSTSHGGARRRCSARSSR